MSNRRARHFWSLFWTFWFVLGVYLAHQGASLWAGVVVTIGLIALALTSRGRRAGRHSFWSRHDG